MQNPKIRREYDGIYGEGSQGMFKFRDKVLAYCHEHESGQRLLKTTESCSEPYWNNVSDITLFADWLKLAANWQAREFEEMPETISL